MLTAAISIVGLCLVLVSETSQFNFQKPNLEQSSLAASRAQSVKEAFGKAYHEYVDFGYPMDEGKRRLSAFSYPFTLHDHNCHILTNISLVYSCPTEQEWLKHTKRVVSNHSDALAFIRSVVLS